MGTDRQQKKQQSASHSRIPRPVLVAGADYTFRKAFFAKRVEFLAVRLSHATALDLAARGVDAFAERIPLLAAGFAGDRKLRRWNGVSRAGRHSAGFGHALIAAAAKKIKGSAGFKAHAIPIEAAFGAVLAGALVVKSSAVLGALQYGLISWKPLGKARR